MKRKPIKYLILIFLFVLSVGKINAEPLAAGSYKIGDEVTYNGMNFYVIANSDENSDAVTMLKAEPFTVDEVNKYGAGHVNRYVESSVGTAYNYNGYGGMAYYGSETCGYTIPERITSVITTGCTTDYEKSEVKYAVDVWSKDKFNPIDLKVDSTGYSARLLTLYDLVNNLGYENNNSGTLYASTNGETPSWIYMNNDNNRFWYWTMSVYKDFASEVWNVSGYKSILQKSVYNDGYNSLVRPVVTLKKVVESDKLQPGDNEITNSSDNDKETPNIVQKVDVPDTIKNKAIMFTIIGCTLIVFGLIISLTIFKTKLRYKMIDKRGKNDDKKSN